MNCPTHRTKCRCIETRQQKKNKTYRRYECMSGCTFSTTEEAKPMKVVPEVQVIRAEPVKHGLLTHATGAIVARPLTLLQMLNG